MRFLIDAQLPIALARALTDAGHPSEAVRDIGLREAEDEAIWDFAAANESVIVTKEEDFAMRVWKTTVGPSVIWLRMGNCSNQELLEHFMPLLSSITERIQFGDRLVEVS